MTSRRGYTLGARTGAKIRPHGGPHWVYPIGVTETPAPETYQKDNTALRRFPANRHPFGAASRRFGKTVAEPDLPGPGAYDHGEETNKHVQLAGASFHGKWHSSRLGDQTFFIRVGICFFQMTQRLSVSSHSHSHVFFTRYSGSFGGTQTHLIPIQLQSSIKKLMTETELKKHRRRLSYLNLYW